MKKFVLLLTLAISFGISLHSFSQSVGYEITCNIEGAEGVIFTLQQRAEGKMVDLDSAVVINGSFKIVGGPIYLPDMVYLNAKAKKKGLPFFLENKKITITAKLDSLSNAKISGSKSHDEFNALSVIMTDNQNKMKEQGKIFLAANQAGDTVKMNESKKQSALLTKERFDHLRDFVKQHPGSFVSPQIIGILATNLKPEEIESMINSLDPEVAKSNTIVEIKARNAALKAVSIGQKAPDFTLNDPNGNSVALSAKLGPKLLLVDFWAAWCAPCRKENPSVVKVYLEFHEKGFDVLGVSLDRNKGDWIKAISDDQLTWTQVSDLQYFNSAVAKLYVVNSIPANFLLDEKGTIVAKNLRGDALYNKVKELLNATK